MSRASLDEWIATAARLAGLVGLIAFGVVWIISNRVEPLLVGGAGSLYGFGKAGEALVLLRRPPPPTKDDA